MKSYSGFLLPNLRSSNTSAKALILLILLGGNCGVASRAGAWADEVEGPRYGGLTVAEWHQRLKDVDPKSPLAATVVAPLTEIVSDTQLRGEDREPFAAFLARVGPPARPVVPVLVSIIRRREPSGTDCLWAARALALMGKAAKDAAPELIDLLFDERIRVSHRQSPVEALAQIGPAHPEAIPALLRLLQYPESATTSETEAAFMRELAAAAIFVVGPDAEVAAPLLIRMIRNRSERKSVRHQAIVALGALESRGTIAIRALAEELVLGQSPALRDEAAKALARIGSDALPTLLQFMESPDAEVRWRVALYVGDLQLEATPERLRTELIRLCQDDVSEVRICAIESYSKLFGRSDDLIRHAISLLAADRRDVRIRAKNLLLALQPMKQEHLTALAQLRDRSPTRISRGIDATLKQLSRPE